MNYTRKIGKTEIEVFPIGLGGMPLSIDGRPDEKQAIAVIHAALDAGVDFIDTADCYCIDDTDFGHNERLIHQALKERGALHKITVATKGGLRRPGGDWVTDARPARLREACEASLKRLGVDAIALYQLHAPDDKVRLEDSVGELARLQKEGKIRHIGLSNVSLDELERALRIVRIESVQNRCNAYDHEDISDGFVAHCAERGISYLPYGPVGGHFGHEKLSRHPVLHEIARSHPGASAYQVLLAWLLSKGPNVIPIPGASKAASIQDSAKAASLQLSAAELKRVDGLAFT